MHFPTASTLNRTLLLTATVTIAVAISTFSLPDDLARVGSVAGLITLLAGALRLGQLQTQRAATLARFLSPSVNALLARHGLSDVQKTSEAEISVVCADIRNFTRFSSVTGSARVMQFLREYYTAVGAAVEAHGGTIKDYAGDGVLVLVGAPLPVQDHADRALRLAQAIRDAAHEVATRWSQHDLPLGIGVGVASGVTTVGMLGSSERLEFAAVGPAVNLASRLCGQAANREILLDERTRELARAQRGAVRAAAEKALSLKGIDTPVAGFVLATD